MSQDTKLHLKIYGAILFFAFVVFPVFSETQDHIYQAPGGVSLFPIDSEAKNYRLDATVRHTTRFYPFFIKDEKYQLINVTWPNGGTVEADCDPADLVHPDVTIKCSVGDDQYYVEFNT